MTVKQRILAIKLMEKVREDPKYAKQLGIVVTCDDGMLMLHREATIKQDKDSQPRRYSVQPRADSRTGSGSQRSR